MSSTIAQVTSILCLPYGYTVTLWCAGAIATADHGLPGRLEILLFAAGAVTGFLLLALVGRAHLDRHVPMRVRSVAVMNAFPVLIAAVLAALPLRALGKPLAFLTASLLGTTIYVVGLAAFAGTAGGLSDS